MARAGAGMDAGAVVMTSRLSVELVQKCAIARCPVIVAVSAPTALALRVADVAAARAALEEQGVTFGGDTFDTGVCHMAFFADPDGNALMLHHRYAPRRES